jgi:hypothetical protein
MSHNGEKNHVLQEESGIVSWVMIGRGSVYVCAFNQVIWDLQGPRKVGGGISTSGVAVGTIQKWRAEA